MIDLAAGLVDAGDGRDQETSSDRARVWSVIGMAMRNEPHIEARLFIPYEGVEIIAHRVKRIRASCGLHGAADITETGIDVLALKPDARQRLMVIGTSRL